MKNLKWVGTSKKDLLNLPKDVIQEIGYALYLTQEGNHYSKAKPFKGYGAGVYELAIRHNKNAYRAIYFLDLIDSVYVIHCFQKKSKIGIKTPQDEIELIKQRIKLLKSVIK